MGFFHVDEGVKKYFDGIIIPTKDGMKSLTARISGGDKTILFWKQDLQSNRIKLPVMSINRSGWRWDAQRFSPPHIAMTTRFVNQEGSRAALVYRPWPCLVDYSFTIWAEFKADVELALYQISTRFHPLCEVQVEFENLKGYIRGKIGEGVNNSDIDIGANELAKVRYDISSTWEAWLPLPEKIMPTILGRVGIVQEYSGEVLGAAEFTDRGGINAVSLADYSFPDQEPEE